MPTLALLGLLGCQRTLALEVRLEAPESPDPFTDVAEVELLAQLDGVLVRVGGGRWDQGPLPFEETFDPALERLVVLGRDPEGRVVSSGASGAVALGAEASAEVRVLFTRVGELSRLSEAGTARDGAAALGLPDGRVLFVGGLDADGCAIEATELVGLDGPRAGPRLSRGWYRPELRALPSGEVLVFGGEVVEGCGDRRAPDGLVVLDPVRNTARPIPLDAPLPTGAALAAVDDSLVLWAGGEGAPTFSTSVDGLDPRRGDLRRVGALDAPRAHAAAAHLGGGRVLLAGGVGSADGGPYADASVFVSRRGAALSGRVPLGAPMRAPFAVTTPAGAVLLAGGFTAADVGTRAVRAVVVGAETAVPLGETSVVTSLTSSVGHVQGVALPDGGLLLLPADGGAPHWIRLLPRAADPLSGAPAAPLAGGVRGDGVVLLQDPFGQRYAFNPGAEAWLGPGASGGRLALDPARPPSAGLGLIPLRPWAWQQTTRGLRGQGAAAARTPSEWAVIGPERYADFTLEVSLRISPDAQAALLFGMDGSEHDFVSLVGSVAAGRSLGRAASRPVSCPAMPTPSLLGAGAQRIRLVRAGDRVTVDAGADGSIEFDCEIPETPLGRVGLGVVRGTVDFDEVRLRPGS